LCILGSFNASLSDSSVGFLGLGRLLISIALF